LATTAYAGIVTQISDGQIQVSSPFYLCSA
jgi:hypothetical protein